MPESKPTLARYFAVYFTVKWNASKKSLRMKFICNWTIHWTMVKMDGVRINDRYTAQRDKTIGQLYTMTEFMLTKHFTSLRGWRDKHTWIKVLFIISAHQTFRCLWPPSQEALHLLHSSVVHLERTGIIQSTVNSETDKWSHLRPFI